MWTHLLRVCELIWWGYIMWTHLLSKLYMNTLAENMWTHSLRVCELIYWVCELIYWGYIMWPQLWRACELILNSSTEDWTGLVIRWACCPCKAGWQSRTWLQFLELHSFGLKNKQCTFNKTQGTWFCNSRCCSYYLKRHCGLAMSRSVAYIFDEICVKPVH